MNAKAMTRLKDHRVDWGIIVGQQGYIMGWQLQLVKLICILIERLRKYDVCVVEIGCHLHDSIFVPTRAAVDRNQYEAARPVVIHDASLTAFRIDEIWEQVNVVKACRQGLIFRTQDAPPPAADCPINIRQHDSTG